MKDWENLRMLLETKDTKDFIEKYTEANLFTILNKAIELYTDRSYNNFFERNIDILWEASTNTQNSYMPALSKLLRRLQEEERGESREKDVLNNIDSSGKLKGFFEEKYKSGNIIIFNEKEKNEAYEVLLEGFLQMSKEEMNDDETEKIDKIREIVEKTINKPCYLMGFCVVPIKNDITDIPTSCRKALFIEGKMIH